MLPPQKHLNLDHLVLKTHQNSTTTSSILFQFVSLHAGAGCLRSATSLDGRPEQAKLLAAAIGNPTGVRHLGLQPRIYRLNTDEMMHAQ